MNRHFADWSSPVLTDEAIQSLDLKPTIQTILQHEFTLVNITDIELRGDEDFDGDPILRVYINYSGDLEKTPGSRAVALDKIRDSLQENHNPSFPVMTFILNKQKKGVSRENK